MSVRWAPSPSSLIKRLLPPFPVGSRLLGKWEDADRPRSCLRCLQPLPAENRSTRACPNCRLLNSPFLRQKYWNLGTGVVALQWTLRGLLVPIAIPLFFELGFLCLVPLMILWFTISKLTQNLPTFPAAILWSLAVAFFAVLALIDRLWLYTVLYATVAGLIFLGGFFGNRWKVARLHRVFGTGDSNTLSSG